MPTELAGGSSRVDFLGLQFETSGLDQVLERLSRVTGDSTYHYIVTPNVDHIVRLDNERDDVDVRSAYEMAALRLNDSKVLAGLAATCGIRLPVVPGSEMTARLFGGVIAPGDRIAIVGAEAALVDAMRALHPGVDFHHHQPPMGMRRNEAAMAEAAAFIARTGARFTFLAVGSPQQELLARRVLSEPGARGCALCIGAGIEFASGTRKRAPRIMQQVGLEWSYRLLQDPRRLWRRYLVEGPRILPILLRWRRARGRAI